MKFAIASLLAAAVASRGSYSQDSYGYGAPASYGGYGARASYGGYSRPSYG